MTQPDAKPVPPRSHIDALRAFAASSAPTGMGPQRLSELAPKALKLIDQYLAGDKAPEVLAELKGCLPLICEALSSIAQALQERKREGAVNDRIIELEKALLLKVIHSGAALQAAVWGLSPTDAAAQASGIGIKIDWSEYLDFNLKGVREFLTLLLYSPTAS